MSYNEPNNNHREPTTVRRKKSIDELLDDHTIEIAGRELTFREILIEIDEEHELLDQIVDAAKKRTEALEELELELQSGDTFDQERAQLVRAVKETSIGPYLRIAHGDIELMGQRDGPFSEFYAQELEE